MPGHVGFYLSAKGKKALLYGVGMSAEEARLAIPNVLLPCRWLKPGKAFGQGCITVVGDAMHPMTPSLGQGGCIALEVTAANPLRLPSNFFTPH